jgi:hypothetical protein
MRCSSARHAEAPAACATPTIYLAYHDAGVPNICIVITTSYKNHVHCGSPIRKRRRHHRTTTVRLVGSSDAGYSFVHAHLIACAEDVNIAKLNEEGDDASYAAEEQRGFAKLR